MRRSAVLCVLMGLMLALNGAWADDFNTPDWRGDPRTTYQKWEFSGVGEGGTDPPPNPSGPDVYQQVPDTPALTSSLSVSGLQLWKPTDLGEEGVWKFEDKITITIGNFNEAYPEKEIWVQLTYYASGPPDVYAMVGETTYYGESVFQEAAGEYIHERWEIFIHPNPESEVIYIAPRDCTAYVDEVVIDTICRVPEPATICLFGLGALALLRRRRA